MSLVENIEKILEEKKEEREGSAEYRELRDFYTKMKQLGLVTKQEYTIPPLDTTGRRVRELMCQSTC